MTAKKDPKDLLKVGRPTDYKPEYCDQAINLFSNGKSQAEVCKIFGIAKHTFQQWEKNIPEFTAAISKARAYSEAWWINYGRKNLENKDLNSRMYELMMMNIHGWNKKSEGNQKIEIIAHEDSLKELK